MTKMPSISRYLVCAAAALLLTGFLVTQAPASTATELPSATAQVDTGASPTTCGATFVPLVSESTLPCLPNPTQLPAFEDEDPAYATAITAGLREAVASPSMQAAAQIKVEHAIVGTPAPPTPGPFPPGPGIPSPSAYGPNISAPSSTTPSSAGATAAAAQSAVTSAPPSSNSFYITSTDIAKEGTTIEDFGSNDPAGPSAQIFLEFGAWCGLNGFFTYVSQVCTTLPNATMAAEYFIDGYWLTHANDTSVTIAVTLNNSRESGDGTTQDSMTNASNFNAAIEADDVTLASAINNYDQAHGYSLAVYVAGGNDIETNFAGPTMALAWMTGFDNASEVTGLNTYDTGAISNYCSSSSCWNQTSYDLNGWTPDDDFTVIWGDAFAYSTPEMYDTPWGYYYNDLDIAAIDSVGYAPAYTGVVWSCGVAGESEPNANQAYIDFANDVGQVPAYRMYLHDVAYNC